MTLDRAGFEALFLDTRAALLAYLARRAPAEDAADLLAEVYLTTWRRRDELPAAEEIPLWLYGVARRLVLDHHRPAPTNAAASVVDVPAGQLLGDDDEVGRRRDQAVANALCSLTPLDRELVTLTTWDRLSTADAARVVGITPGTARVRLHRARARLGHHPQLLQLVDDAEPPDGQVGEQHARLSPVG